MIPCLIIMHSYGGGAEKVALELAHRLDKNRFTASVCALRHSPELAAQLPDGVAFSMPEKPGILPWLAQLRRVRKQTRQNRVVLGSLELQSIFWAALLAPGRSVAWLHKDVSGYLHRRSKMYGWLYRHILGWALRRCCAVACVSRGIEASAMRLWPDLRPRLRVLWNPIDIVAVRKAAKQNLPPALEPCFQKPVVLAVGRLEPQKAFHLLLHAHAVLRKRGIDHNLCIAGEGSQRAFLQENARRLGVAESVFLPGFLCPYPLMARAKVLALSSYFEGFALVLAEALCVGLPIVAADCPSGPGEVLEGGIYGTLFPTGDVEALAEALQNALQAPTDTALLSAGMRRAEAFSPDATIGAWQTLLQETATRQ